MLVKYEQEVKLLSESSFGVTSQHAAEHKNNTMKCTSNLYSMPVITVCVCLNVYFLVKEALFG